MIKLSAKEDDKKEISFKKLALGFLVCISMVACLGLTDLGADVINPEENNDEIETRELYANHKLRVEHVANEATLHDPDWETMDGYHQKMGEYTQQITDLRASGMGWGDIVHTLNKQHGFKISPSALGLGRSRKSSETAQKSKHSGIKSKENKGLGLALGHNKDYSGNRGGGLGAGKGSGDGGGKNGNKSGDKSSGKGGGNGNGKGGGNGNGKGGGKKK